MTLVFQIRRTARRKFLLVIFMAISTFLFIVLWKSFIFESRKKKNDNSDNKDMFLSCDDFKNWHLEHLSHLAEGWTKIVYKGFWRGIPVAIKTINERGNGLDRCNKSFKECISTLQEGLAREAKLLTSLTHSNIIKLYGSCLEDDEHFLESGLIVVELGKPLTSFSLVQTSFQRRLQLAKDVCSLLSYFATHSSGPIALPDLRLQQFVVVDDRLKLCDLDDIEIGDRKCASDADCISYHDNKEILRVNCIDQKCLGLNDAMNVWKACYSVLPILLSFATPKQLENAVNKTLECKNGKWSSKDLLNSVQVLNDFLRQY